MNRISYLEKIKYEKEPYQYWIDNLETKRTPRETLIPEGYRIFSDPDGSVDPGLTEALREYGAFKGIYDYIYTDEDEGREKRKDPFFKPDYSPDTLEEFYYPGGLTIISSEIVSEVRSLKKYESGTLEFLRECARRCRFPLHIPEVLYHAYSHHTYEYSEKEEWAAAGSDPEDLLCVIILSKDNPGLCRKCVSGLLMEGEREKLKINCVVVDNGSSPENLKSYENMADDFGISYYREEREFNYSALCNIGVRRTRGRFLLFINDDVEFPEDSRILDKMLKEAAKETTGAVGCKLLYPGEEKIQHCGITLLRTGAGHKLSGYDDRISYYRGINRITRNAFAVTGACLMVERRKFEEAGGFDEELSVAYTDVDLCAALICLGYYNVCVNSSYLIHHESLSRKADSLYREKYERLKSERSYFYEKYRILLKHGDPFYNRNLTDTGLDYRVNVPDAPKPIEPEAAVYKDNPLFVSVSGKDKHYLKRTENGKKICFNIERFGTVMSDEYGNEDCFEIGGWAYVKGRPGYEYDTLIFIKSGGKEYLIDTERVLRDDLPEVFPDEKDIGLSGFLVKIKAGSFEKLPEREDIMIILEKKGTFGGTGYIAT